MILDKSPLNLILNLSLNSALYELSRLLLPLFEPFEYLVNLIHELIRLSEATEQVIHNSSIRLELAFLYLLEDLEDHLEGAILLTGVHKQLKQFQVQFGVLHR